MKQSGISLKEQFDNAGQGQVFRFWEELNDDERKELERDASEVDLEEIDSLVESLVLGSGESETAFDAMKPAPYISHFQNGGDTATWEKAYADGEAALKAGKVAAFTVAGGQGTRLGYDGPKGTFPVTPVQQNTLFQVFAEKILAAGRRYNVKIPWLIMTSPQNHEATVQAFEEKEYFGLNQAQVTFFPQGRIAAVDKEGKILLATKSTIASTPDGHGGSLRALVRSGAIKAMKEKGIEVISYFQVDNPLVKAIDPAFIGFHLQSGSEMSSKMIPKAYPEEKVGHFCMHDEKMLVIEYSDLPKAMQEERDSNGQLKFLAGSIAIHILSLGFVERIGGGKTDAKLPFHRADKKIATVDEDGNAVKPESANGVKFEMFVFDALPFASCPIVIETLREEDFSPVKNAEGLDSPQTCKEDQLKMWSRWLRKAGVEITVDQKGLPSFEFEISPLFADSEKNFVERWRQLEEKPTIEKGTVLA